MPLQTSVDSERNEDRPAQILTDRNAWTMSALTELRGLSLITTKICSSFSRPMKFPNHDFLASLAARQKTYTVEANTQSQKKNSPTQSLQELKQLHTLISTYSGLDSGVRLDMSSDVGTERDNSLLTLAVQ